jgi:hypothetical protein
MPVYDGILISISGLEYRHCALKDRRVQGVLIDDMPSAALQLTKHPSRP